MINISISMMKIYCIEDINGKKYVGQTTQYYLCNRLSGHRQAKKNRCAISSCELDLDNCKIYILEESDEKGREQYWINKIDCVNHYKLSFNRKEHRKIAGVKERENELQQIRRHYKKSWGGDERFFNNLLNINLSIFQ